MLSWIMLIIALVLFSVLGVWIFAGVFGRGEALPPMMETADVKEANRAAVEAGEFDKIQLEVVHRGYRMDQVDALIAQLTGADPAGYEAGAEREIAVPAAADVPAENRVDLEEEQVEREGELTHGSNETAHR
ncbi:hypothetical protein M5J20_04195 [Corynebacterium sp. TA-R-1]|uniref:DivIVA domain-containing protein n=1 Tax=Corynebacterium stercoris TaxID=2943490 RepID=A0ABT1G2T9_9CORY|nr:hypothetical protein [Corynebacterium stercoris]MCP1387388.1 hypothetical protein [Corynebacterium stercoris]